MADCDSVGMSSHDRAVIAPPGEKTRISTDPDAALLASLRIRRAEVQREELELAELIIRTAIELVFVTRPAGGHFDLTGLQGRVLARLCRQPFALMCRLRESEGVSRTGISKVVSALAEKGFVQRGTSVRESQVVVIRAAKRGRKYLGQLSAAADLAYFLGLHSIEEQAVLRQAAGIQDAMNERIRWRRK